MPETHEVLEALSRDTWGRLRDARALHIRFGEETITDLLLLDFKRQFSSRMRVAQTSKSLEKVQGTDWEWWIGATSIGWLRFAVQAKKLNLTSHRYDALNHRVGSAYQIDLLERYATKNRAIPLYCFYNYKPVSVSEAAAAWHCCSSSADVELLACTVAPLSVVKDAIGQYGRRNFADIHGSKKVIPWRCLVKCERVQRWYAQRHGLLATPSSKKGDRLDFGTNVHVYEKVPDVVKRAVEQGVIRQFPENEYDPNLGQYPRRVSVIEYLPKEAERIERLSREEQS